MAVDAEYGISTNGNRVICNMLAHIANQRHAPVRPSRQKAPVRLLVKAMTVKKAKAPPKPQRRIWSRQAVSAALDDGVVRGRISGTQAMAALRAFEGR